MFSGWWGNCWVFNHGLIKFEIPVTNALKIRRGPEATRQSNPNPQSTMMDLDLFLSPVLFSSGDICQQGGHPEKRTPMHPSKWWGAPEGRKNVELDQHRTLPLNLERP